MYPFLSPIPYPLLKLISSRDNFPHYSSVRLCDANVVHSTKDNNKRRNVQLDYCLVVWFYAGFVNGYSAEYDAINAVVSSLTSLSNVSLAVKEFNISDETNSFNIGEIYKIYY